MSYIEKFPGGFSPSVDKPLDKRFEIADITAADAVFLATAYVGLVVYDVASGSHKVITATDGTQVGLEYSDFGSGGAGEALVTVDVAATASEDFSGTAVFADDAYTRSQQLEITVPKTGIYNLTVIGMASIGNIDITGGFDAGGNAIPELTMLLRSNETTNISAHYLGGNQNFFDQDVNVDINSDVNFNVDIFSPNVSLTAGDVISIWVGSGSNLADGEDSAIALWRKANAAGTIPANTAIGRMVLQEVPTSRTVNTKLEYTVLSDNGLPTASTLVADAVAAGEMHKGAIYHQKDESTSGTWLCMDPADGTHGTWEQALTSSNIPNGVSLYTGIHGPYSDENRLDVDGVQISADLEFPAPVTGRLRLDYTVFVRDTNALFVSVLYSVLNVSTGTEYTLPAGMSSGDAGTDSDLETSQHPVFFVDATEGDTLRLMVNTQAVGRTCSIAPVASYVNVQQLPTAMYIPIDPDGWGVTLARAPATDGTDNTAANTTYIDGQVWTDSTTGFKYLCIDGTNGKWDKLVTEKELPGNNTFINAEVPIASGTYTHGTHGNLDNGLTDLQVIYTATKTGRFNLKSDALIGLQNAESEDGAWDTAHYYHAAMGLSISDSIVASWQAKFSDVNTNATNTGSRQVNGILGMDVVLDLVEGDEVMLMAYIPDQCWASTSIFEVANTDWNPAGNNDVLAIQNTVVVSEMPVASYMPVPDEGYGLPKIVEGDAATFQDKTSIVEGSPVFNDTEKRYGGTTLAGDGVTKQFEKFIYESDLPGGTVLREASFVKNSEQVIGANVETYVDLNGTNTNPLNRGDLNAFKSTNNDEIILPKNKKLKIEVELTIGDIDGSDAGEFFIEIDGNAVGAKFGSGSFNGSGWFSSNGTRSVIFTTSVDKDSVLKVRSLPTPGSIIVLGGTTVAGNMANRYGASSVAIQELPNSTYVPVPDEGYGLPKIVDGDDSTFQDKTTIVEGSPVFNDTEKRYGGTTLAGDGVTKQFEKFIYESELPGGGGLESIHLVPTAQLFPAGTFNNNSDPFKLSEVITVGKTGIFDLNVNARSWLSDAAALNGTHANTGDVKLIVAKNGDLANGILGSVSAGLHSNSKDSVNWDASATWNLLISNAALSQGDLINFYVAIDRSYTSANTALRVWDDAAVLDSDFNNHTSLTGSTIQLREVPSAAYVPLPEGSYGLPRVNPAVAAEFQDDAGIVEGSPVFNTVTKRYGGTTIDDGGSTKEFEQFIYESELPGGTPLRSFMHSAGTAFTPAQNQPVRFADAGTTIPSGPGSFLANGSVTDFELVKGRKYRLTAMIQLIDMQSSHDGAQFRFSFDGTQFGPSFGHENGTDANSLDTFRLVHVDTYTPASNGVLRIECIGTSGSLRVGGHSVLGANNPDFRGATSFLIEEVPTSTYVPITQDAWGVEFARPPAQDGSDNTTADADFITGQIWSNTLNGFKYLCTDGTAGVWDLMVTESTLPGNKQVDSFAVGAAATDLDPRNIIEGGAQSWLTLTDLSLSGTRRTTSDIGSQNITVDPGRWEITLGDPRTFSHATEDEFEAHIALVEHGVPTAATTDVFGQALVPGSPTVNSFYRDAERTVDSSNTWVVDVTSRTRLGLLSVRAVGNGQGKENTSISFGSITVKQLSTSTFAADTNVLPGSAGNPLNVTTNTNLQLSDVLAGPGNYLRASGAITLPAVLTPGTTWTVRYGGSADTTLGLNGHTASVGSNVGIAVGAVITIIAIDANTVDIIGGTP